MPASLRQGKPPQGHKELSQLRRARTAITEGRYSDAIIDLRAVLLRHPEMWWVQVELIEAQRKAANVDETTSPGIVGLYSPNYSENAYQDILYRQVSPNSISFTGVDRHDLQEIIEAYSSRSMRLVFHQHWLLPIFSHCTSTRGAVRAVESYFRRIRTLKSLGARVLWTMHNFLEHDLPLNLRAANLLAIRNIVTYADKILVHGPEANQVLSNQLGRDLGDKIVELRHPMYDGMLTVEPVRPPELSDDARVFRFLSFGLLRPYKGTYELVRAMRQLLEGGRITSSQLVLAGKIFDPAVHQLLLRLPKKVKDSIAVVDRRFSESELVWLLQNSDVAVFPYRAILTSGAYHVASTFKLPSVAPSIGQFRETSKHDCDILMYESGLGLEEILLYARRIGPEKLSKVGHRAYDQVTKQTETSFAMQFQKILNDLWQY